MAEVTQEQGERIIRSLSAIAENLHKIEQHFDAFLKVTQGIRPSDKSQGRG